MDTYKLKSHLYDLNVDGYTVVRNAVDKTLIDKIVKEFDDWSMIPENKFKKFNRNRVTNFHVYSENTKEMVTNKHVNEILKKLFNKDQAVYSSLFFREGTSQGFHRDTPHFYTNPIDQYYGVWYALEDIDQRAGPLKYIVGSHKLEIPNGYDIYNKLFGDKDENFELSPEDNELCLDEYNKTAEQACIDNKLLIVDEKNYDENKINKGDVIIWHPKLVHGGSMVLDNKLTRYSMVTHNIPLNAPVFSAKHFFAPNDTPEYSNNVREYGYIVHNKVSIVDYGCPPRVQGTYL